MYEGIGTLLIVLLVFFSFFFFFSGGKQYFYTLKKENIPLFWRDIFPGRKQARNGFQTSKSVLCGV